MRWLLGGELSQLCDVGTWVYRGSPGHLRKQAFLGWYVVSALFLCQERFACCVAPCFNPTPPPPAVYLLLPGCCICNISLQYLQYLQYFQ